MLFTVFIMLFVIFELLVAFDPASEPTSNPLPVILSHIACMCSGFIAYHRWQGISQFCYRCLLQQYLFYNTTMFDGLLCHRAGGRRKLGFCSWTTFWRTCKFQMPTRFPPHMLLCKSYSWWVMIEGPDTYQTHIFDCLTFVCNNLVSKMQEHWSPNRKDGNGLSLCKELVFMWTRPFNDCAHIVEWE